jgi:Uma2 family endonuclease
MKVPLESAWTLERFLAWEEHQEPRYEFDGLQPVAMTGGTAAHSAIQANLMRALGNRLDGKPCRPHGSELKIQVAGRVRYPDAFVVCTPVAPRATVVNDPVVVFEILGESTSHNDLVVKNAEYRATPSIQRYVVLQQSHAGATVFARRGADWLADPVAGDTAVLAMPEIGVDIPLSELYAGIEMAAPEHDEALVK